MNLSYPPNPSLPEEEQNGDPSRPPKSSTSSPINAAHTSQDSQLPSRTSHSDDVIKSPPSSVDKSEALFSMYLVRSDEDDKKITGRWKGECDAILIFTGLFSAALAVLISVSIQGLQPGPQDTSAFYLGNIYHLLANSSGSQPIIYPTPSDPPKFSAPKSAVLVNSLWFLSLLMSFTGALLAVFIQQWAQSYLQATGERHSPKDRARIRSFHARGLENLHLNRVTRTVPILIHVSLFLFFSGLPVFLFNINRTVFNVVVTWLGLCVAGYACITLMPIFYQNSPYYSPLSSFTWWCVTNTLFIIHQLLKNFMPQNSSVFRWYHKSHFHWPSLRAMQEAAENVALHMPQDIDYIALSWMFQTLVVDEEFEQFFDALPSLHDSKALVNAEEKFIKPNEKKLSHALIGMMDRTLLSELVSEDVKQRRIIICTKAVGATSLLGPWWTLRRVLCGDWQEFSGSVHFGLCVQEWKNMSHPVLAFYAQCAVAVTLSTVQKRDNHWFQLASGQLSESKSLLRNYFADDDSILLDDVIFIIRRTMEAFSGSKDRRSDVQEASSKTLELICSFDIRNTLEDLQHHFCSLWNELVDKAEKNSDPDFRSLCIMMLKSTRRLYITLHENTSSSPTAFSTTTDDLNGVLGYASSYPRCINHPSRRVSELKLDELPRNTATAPRDTASLVEVISAFIPVPPPRLSTPPSRVIPSDQTPPFSTVRSPPHPFIPSPNVPIAPLVGPSNPGVSGPHSYPTTLRSSGISQPVSPAAMGGVYSQQDTHSRFAPSESSSTFSSEVPMINIDPPSPPKSPFDTLKGAYLSHGEDVPSAMGEAYSQQDAHVRFAQSESASTSSSESLEIVIESPSPPESLFDISQAAYLSLGEDVPATMGEFYSQQGVHVPVARSLSTSTSSSGSLEIVIVPASPPESLADISPIAIRAEDVPATRGEVYSQDGAHIRFSPSEYTSTSFSESPVIDIVTPSRPESPYGTTIPIPPPPAGSIPSIDASPGPPRTRRSKKVLLISEETAGGGSEPMPSPPLSAGGAKGTPPILKFSGYGDFAGLLYHSPHSVMYEEDLYPTALHLFEAHKFLYHRPDLAERIRQCERVEDVTAMSEELGEFVRRDWGNVALSTMDDVLYLKFRQHGDLRALLLNTYPADLVYVESGDAFWGDGAGVGMNELGKSLVRVRDRLRKEEDEGSSAQEWDPYSHHDQ